MIRNYIHRIFFFALSLLIFNGCTSETNSAKEKPLIAISKTTSSKKYQNWLKESDSSFRIVNLYDLSLDSALASLEKCSGLLLTGGEDIHPAWYDRPEDTVKCNTINLRRDSIEYYASRRSVELQIPILGICRGMQMINVAQGGSLIADIPSSSKLEEKVPHREKPFEPVFHPIVINQASILFAIAQTNKAEVLSNHHQGVDELGKGLRDVAHTFDNLPEAVEWKKPYEKTFLLGVQFHPEAMDWDIPISKRIAKYFLREVKRTHKERVKEPASK